MKCRCSIPHGHPDSWTCLHGVQWVKRVYYVIQPLDQTFPTNIKFVGAPS